MASPDFFLAFMDALPLAGSAFGACLRRRFRDYHLDLTLERVQVPHYLWGHAGVSQQEITRAANRDKATMAAMLDNLVRRDLVERRADSHDRRTNCVVRTPKGQALDPSQLRTCLNVLAKIT
jgi:DNA-binding MarR family transcriptional regulator